MRMNTELRAALAVSALVAFLAAALSFLAPYTERQLSSSITLTDRAFAVLRQVEVRNDQGSYTLTLEDGVFRCNKLAGMPCSSKAFEKMAEDCTHIEAMTVPRMNDRTDPGFDAPHSRVTISYTDDTLLHLTIGAKNEEGTGYYLQLVEGGPVYLLSPEDAAPFLEGASRYLDKELVSNTSKSQSLPEKLQYSNAHGSFTVERLAKPFANGAGEWMEYTITADDGRTAYADPERLRENFADLNTLTADRVVHLHPSDGELSSYGVTRADGSWACPLRYTINGEETTLYLGNRSGDFYYICKDGVGALFGLPLDQMGWENADLFALMCRTLFAPAQQDVAEIQIETADRAYTLTLDEVGGADCGGTRLSDRSFERLYGLLLSCRAEYELDSRVENIRPDLTMTFKMRGSDETHTLRLVPYGLRRHAIELDGEALYAVRAGYVQAVTAALEAAAAGRDFSVSW